MFYIILHQNVNSKGKESFAVLFNIVFPVPRIVTAYRGFKLKASIHNKKDTISDPCNIYFDFSVAQAWNLAYTRVGNIHLFNKFEYILNLCKVLCIKKNILIFIHTRSMGSTYYLSHCTLLLPMEEKGQLDFHGDKNHKLPFFS